MKKKLVIILIPNCFRKIFIDRFEINEFKKFKDINVEFHELINFLNPKFKKAFQKKIKNKNLKIFKSIKSWKQQMMDLKKLYDDKILIINEVQCRSLASFKVNYFLKKHNFKTIEILQKYSLINTPLKRINFFEFLSIFFINTKKVFIFLKTKFFLNLKKIFSLYPEYIFKTGKFNFVNSYTKSKIIYANSEDYTMFLNKKKKLKKNFVKKKFGIFLEAPTPLFQGDTYITGDDPSVFGDREKWILSLNNFFNFIEKNLNIKIKIAPHPKVRHKSKFPNYYFGREIIFSKLRDIASYSKLFISRSSSAMSYAVMCNKPAIFITNSKIINGPKYYYQKKFSSEFGSGIVNVDENNNKLNLKKLLIINKRKFKAFRHNYLSARNDKKKNCEIIKDLF